MENKVSFILYADQRNVIEMLPDDKAGQLIKHIFAYVNDENPHTDDPLIKIAFEPIKQQFKRDLAKWKTTKEGRSVAGKASAEARRLAKLNQQTSTNPTNVDFVQQTSTNSTVNVNVNDNVDVNVNANKKNDIDERKLKFASTLKPFVEVYGREMINDFFKYWTEPNKSNTKFKQELEKTWSVERRLETWSKNDFGKSKPENKTKPNTYTPIKLID
jgi:hypothetical protein